MNGIGKEIDTIKQAYGDNPQALQQKIMQGQQGGGGNVSEQTLMLMAYNMLNREAADKANQLKLQQGGGPPGTVQEQVTQEAVGRKQQELAQTVGKNMQRENQMMQQNMQKMAQQGGMPQRPPQGIAAMQQRPTQMAASGGLMKAYRGGGQVQSFSDGGLTESDKRKEYERKMRAQGLTEEQLAEAMRKYDFKISDILPEIGSGVKGSEFETLLDSKAGVPLPKKAQDIPPNAGITTQTDTAPQVDASQTKPPFDPGITPLRQGPKTGIQTEAKPNSQTTSGRYKELQKQAQGLGDIGQDLELRDAMSTDEAIGNAEKIAQASFGDSMSREEMMAAKETERLAGRENLGIDDRRKKHDERLARLEAVYTQQENPQEQAMDRFIAGLTAMAGSSSLGAGFANSATASLKMKGEQQLQTRANAKDLWEKMTSGENDIAGLELKTMELADSLYRELKADQRQRGTSKTAATNMQLQNDAINRRTELDVEKTKLEYQAKAMQDEFKLALQEAGFRDQQSLRNAVRSDKGLIKVAEVLLGIEETKAATFATLMEQPDIKRGLQSDDKAEREAALTRVREGLGVVATGARFDMIVEVLGQILESAGADTAVLQALGSGASNEKQKPTDNRDLEKQYGEFLKTEGYL